MYCFQRESWRTSHDSKKPPFWRDLEKDGRSLEISAGVREMGDVKPQLRLVGRTSVAESYGGACPRCSGLVNTLQTRAACAHGDLPGPICSAAQEVCMEGALETTSATCGIQASSPGILLLSLGEWFFSSRICILPPCQDPGQNPLSKAEGGEGRLGIAPRARVCPYSMAARLAGHLAVKWGLYFIFLCS